MVWLRRALSSRPWARGKSGGGGGARVGAAPHSVRAARTRLFWGVPQGKKHNHSVTRQPRPLLFSICRETAMANRSILLAIYGRGRFGLVCSFSPRAALFPSSFHGQNVFLFSCGPHRRQRASQKLSTKKGRSRALADMCVLPSSFAVKQGGRALEGKKGPSKDEQCAQAPNFFTDNWGCRGTKGRKPAFVVIERRP